MYGSILSFHNFCTIGSVECRKKSSWINPFGRRSWNVENVYLEYQSFIITFLLCQKKSFWSCYICQPFYRIGKLSPQNCEKVVLSLVQKSMRSKQLAITKRATFRKLARMQMLSYVVVTSELLIDAIPEEICT